MHGHRQTQQKNQPGGVRVGEFVGMIMLDVGLSIVNSLCSLELEREVYVSCVSECSKKNRDPLYLLTD